MVLVVSCTPKPTPVPLVTGEASVDEVATDISDASDTDDELDTSNLDDVDSILAGIENI